MEAQYCSDRSISCNIQFYSQLKIGCHKIFMFLKSIENITIVQADPKDAIAVYNLIQKHKEDLFEWVPALKTIHSANILRLYFTKKLQKYQSNHTSLECCIYEDEQLVGLIAIQHENQVFKTCELGYWLVKSARGKGIMSICLSAMIEYVFEETDLNRIELRIPKGNTASISLAKKLHFVQEGCLREAAYFLDQYHDIVVFSFLRRDYSNSGHNSL